MDLNYFDLIAAIIILLLGLKGILNGFFKEIFGLIGIVGGIFIASRVGNEVGAYLNELIFHFTSDAAVTFLGFLTTLALFWLLMVLVGTIFKKLTLLSGLGALDKVLGFVFGASKFFLIASVIAHAAYNIQAVKSSLESTLKTSILFPIMVETGKFIIKMDPVTTPEKINSSTRKQIDEIQQKLKEN